MAVLSDIDIRRRLRSSPNYQVGIPSDLGIDPCKDNQIQPASIDLTLADEWLTYLPFTGHADWAVKREYREATIDMDHAKEVETVKIVADKYVLQSHELVLCSTIEYVDIPYDLQGSVYGKSSLGRLGLLVHITAGFIDPGFKGKITLEMYNLNDRPIILRAGKPICQLSMTKLSSPAEKPYGHPDLGSHYQDQTEVTASRYDG